ncbi:MAG: YraN family protein [Mariprofundus sp.]|nr:YraN family protein [Mariprofundus sp.]
MSTNAGNIGESQACRYLEHRGHQIIARNVRLGRGELDIISMHKELLLFIEVKAHNSRESALLAVDKKKCARLRSAAEMWLSLHADYSHRQCRFDLIIITPRVGWMMWLGPHIEHMEDIIR